MTLNSDRRLVSPSATWEQANAALKERRDIPRDLIDAAWRIGPNAVLALANTYPTSEAITEEERERRRRLRLAEVRRVSEIALQAVEAIEGRYGDSTRRDVYVLLNELRASVEVLAAWCRKDINGETVDRETWLQVRTAAESQPVKEVLTKVKSLVLSAIADSHVKKRPRKR
jgi:hypothetical protein